MVELNEIKNKNKPVEAGEPSSIESDDSNHFLKTERAVMVVCRGKKCGYGGECLAG